MTNILNDKNFNPGCYKDRPDARDVQYKDRILGAPVIDYTKGYDVEVELKNKFGVELKRENQNGSLSCVGQAWSKYAEVLNIVEIKQQTDFSAKSIYEQIYLPNGGASIRDGAKVIVSGGVALEQDLSSYEAGNPPSESYMRRQTITDDLRAKMKRYKAKEYGSIGSADPDYLALAIMNNWGAVGAAYGDNPGWKNYIVLPPVKSYGDWGHAFYFVAFGKDKQGIWFDFLNSWGNNWGKNGRGRMYYGLYNMVDNEFGAWTLIDAPNTLIDLNYLNYLIGKGIKYIQRTQNGVGQVYRLESNQIIFLDSNKGADRHIPLVDEAVKNWSKEGRLIGISENDFTRLTNN